MTDPPVEPHRMAIEAPLDISVIISVKNNRPCVELRRAVQTPELIKTLISCAVHNVPVVVMPKFTNRMQSLNTLVEKGVIYRDGDSYFYTI